MQSIPVPPFTTELLVVGALLFVVCGALAYHRAAAWLWVACVGLLMAWLHAAAGVSSSAMTTLWGVFIVLSVLALPTPLRRLLIGVPLLALFRKILPQVSQTEQEALDADSVRTKVTMEGPQGTKQLEHVHVLLA